MDIPCMVIAKCRPGWDAALDIFVALLLAVLEHGKIHTSLLSVFNDYKKGNKLFYSYFFLLMLSHMAN